MSQWWVGRRGADPVGPVSTETLVRGVKEKKVPPNALVCRVGEQQWLHVSQVDELWDKINPEEATTAITEKPWFNQVDSSPPAGPPQPEPSAAAEKLTDADDDDDDATRIYDAKRGAAALARGARQPPAETDANSPKVPLQPASTSEGGAAATTAHVAQSIPKVAPAKAAAPSFRAPASLTRKAEPRETGAPAASGSVGGAKEVVKAPKAVIPAPRFGVDRVVQASPIAAGEFISKPPSVRPEPTAGAAVPTIPRAPATPQIAAEHQHAQGSPRAAQQTPQQIARRSADAASPPAQSAEPRPAAQSAPKRPQQAATRPGQSSPPPARQAAPRPAQGSQPDALQAAPRPAQSSPPAAQQVPRPASNPPAQQAAPRPVQSSRPAARQTGSGQLRQTAATNTAKTPGGQPADRVRQQQPIPPVPTAVVELPPNSEIAALVRDNVDVSLVETRPERRAPTGPRQPVQQSTPQGRDASNKHVTSQAVAHAKHASADADAHAAPIVVRPIVNVAEPDDDDATVIRHAPVAPVAPVATVTPAPEALATMPDEGDDDITIAREVPSMPPVQATEDEDATVIKKPVNSARAVPTLDELSAKGQHTPDLSDLERLAARTADAAHSVQKPDTPAAEHHAPVPPPPPPQPVPAVAEPAASQANVAPRSLDAPGDLYDADDEALPARAKDYAGAHGPPSTPENARPRPAAGTPLPPSVIVAPHQQHHVPVDALGRTLQPHSELTHPALRTIRPPGTVQISIAALIVGAMAIVVIVLAAVLVLR